MPTHHVLFAWELGANRGHVTALGAIARALAVHGVRITFAVQRLDAMRALRPLDQSWNIVQAPVWPGLLVNAGFGSMQATSSYADILAGLGLRDSGAVEFMLRGWDGLMSALRPDAVLANYAPMVQLAARGRIPVVAEGTGFSLPPDHLPEFPLLLGVRPSFPEREVLRAVNLGLERTGRSALSRLPEIMSADRRVPHTFAIFDPYHATRAEPMLPPILPAWTPVHVGDGEEIFVYFSETAPGAERIYDALARLGSRVRVHVPNLAAVFVEKLKAAGVSAEPRPLSVADIARRSRLVVSHGGLGLVSMTLAAGLPQLVLAPDLEKRLIGEAVTGLGVGETQAWRDATTEGIVASIEAMCADVDIRHRASQLGHKLAPLLNENTAEKIAQAILSVCVRR